MKRVLVLYAKYGGGHLSAANSIQNFIEENYYFDTQVKSVDCVEYASPVLSGLTIEAYKDMAKKAPWAWKKVYYNSENGALSHISTDIAKKMARKLHTLFKEFLPDIVISTHPFATQMTSYLKEHENVDCKLATVLTDFAPHAQWLVGKDYCDLFFVSNDDMKTELTNDYNIPETKVFVTGIPLSDRFLDDFKEDECFDVLRLKKEKKVLLFFGGGEFGLGEKRTVKVLKSLANHLDEYQIVAISGRNKKMNNEFLKLYKKVKNDDLHIYKYTINVPELMYISSLVVTKPGGLTSTESLASGLPMLIINPIPGQEEENARFLEKSGAAVWIKKDDDIDMIVDNLLKDTDKLEKMKENCLALSKRDSTKNICNIILEKNKK
nr:glycosyltransferase [Clostridia bacterium]